MITVIPAYLSRPGHPAQLSRCVAALLAGTLPTRVVVVDDGSPLPFSVLPAGVELLRSPVNRGPAAARNRGLERALELGARVVLFTDVDCVPDAGWAAAMDAFLADGAHAAAGGITRALGTTLLDRYQDFSGALNGRWLLPGHRELLYAASCNLAVRAGALADVRFDERFPVAAGEDVDFCLRLRPQGPVGLATQALVRHDFDYGSTLRGLPALLRSSRRYGEADPLLWEKHPGLRRLSTEGCAAADLLAAMPPVEPEAWRRGASSRVRPRRFRPAMVLLRWIARRAYRAGQARPLPWRTAPAAIAPPPGPR